MSESEDVLTTMIDGVLYLAGTTKEEIAIQLIKKYIFKHISLIRAVVYGGIPLFSCLLYLFSYIYDMSFNSNTYKWVVFLMGLVTLVGPFSLKQTDSHLITYLIE